MKKDIFFPIVFFVLGFSCYSASVQVEPRFANYTCALGSKETNIDATKFAYAEMIYQSEYGAYKKWVNGGTVSPEVAKSVENCKFLFEALDILGNDGWELVSTTLRNLNNGWETTYTFKKRLN